MRGIKRIALWTLSLSVTAVGVMHFVDPAPYKRIVPPPLPAPAAVYISGFFEILGGLGLLIPKTRKAAAWGLIALFVAVFPANLYMAFGEIQLQPERPLPAWVAWARLPFQALFIAWAWWFTRDPALPSERAG